MDISDELCHAPWGELIRRARESGPNLLCAISKCCGAIGNLPR